MARVIELFGLPGSGKTFLANALSTALAKNNITVLQRSEAVKLCLQRKDDGLFTSLFKKLPSAIWHRIIHEHYCLPELMDFSSRHFKLTTLYQNELRKSETSNRTIRNILGAFVNTCVERQLFEMYGCDDEVFLVDEGFCHRLFTLYGNLSLVYDQDMIRRYVELMPHVQGAIFIATPPDLCIERMEKRKRVPVLFNSDHAQTTRDILNHGAELFEQLTEELNFQNISYCRYDGISPAISTIAIYCQSVT